MPEPVDRHAHCSVSALARAVAERMDRGSDRAALLTWLHRIDSVKAGASMAESGPMTPDRPLVSAMSATTVDFAFEPCASH
jgi:hypothetical protein